MKIRSALLCALLTATGFASTVFAAETAAPAPAASPETELGGKMSALSNAFKKLRQQVADPAKNEDSLKHVAVIRESAEASLTLDPEKTADVPEADRAKFKEDFVARMEALIAEIGKLEKALQAGDNDQAKQIVQAMADAQREGHREFRKKKPEKK